MNLKNLVTGTKALETKKIFSPTESVLTMVIQAGGVLKEHKTAVPALLTCVTGEVLFENEKGISEKLGPGDFIQIEPEVKHWVKAEQDSTLLLIK